LYQSSHFSFVLDEVLKNGCNIETSSAYDIEILKVLLNQGRIDKSIYIICNGFKRPAYVEGIAELINEGFENTVPVLDNISEFDQLDLLIKNQCNLGIRIATEEEPQFQFYTSRLGIQYKNIVPFYNDKIKSNDKFKLKMLHFFINTGIKDTAHFWNELIKSVNVYCELKKICPELDSLNIGGGFPFKNSLGFEYDYSYIAEEIISQIKITCNQNGVNEPNIFTEFGTYTVAESGANFFSVLDVKQQNDRELWYMIDGSFITYLPDTWAINQRYILLAINKWDQPVHRVNLGGLTCDSQDYYSDEVHLNAVFLPKELKKNAENPLYIGFFHTGAYQESIGGFGGIQHCLVPGPKHVLIDKDEDGNFITKLFAKEQSHKSMLRILGY